MPPGPSTGNVIEIEIVSAETSKQSFVDEVTLASEVPVTEPSSSVAVVQPLIHLEEEPVATNAKEEPEAAVNPSAI